MPGSQPPADYEVPTRTGVSVIQIRRPTPCFGSSFAQISPLGPPKRDARASNGVVKPPRIPTCHPERKHWAKGLCNACYNAARERRVDLPAATCHPQRSHHARGLCGPCYLVVQRKSKLSGEGLPARKRVAVCHPDRRHRATGLCEACYTAQRRANEIERARACSRDWKAKHPEKAKEYGAKRRARRAGAPVNDLTAAHWQEILAEHNWTCVYCLYQGDDLTMDHSLPLSRGGSHTKSNIVPACAHCNKRKGAQTPAEFFATLQVRRVRLAA